MIHLTHGLELPLSHPKWSEGLSKLYRAKNFLEDPQEWINFLKANPYRISFASHLYKSLTPSVAHLLKLLSTSGKKTVLLKGGATIFFDEMDERVRINTPHPSKLLDIEEYEFEGKKHYRVVLEIDCRDDYEVFQSFIKADVNRLSFAQTRELLYEAGEWHRLRVRPFDCLMFPDENVDALMIVAIDQRPASFRPIDTISEFNEEFEAGLKVIAKIFSQMKKKVYLCKRPEDIIPGDGYLGVVMKNVAGPYPSSCVGTLIHHLFRFKEGSRIAYLSYFDVIRWGFLFLTGRQMPVRPMAITHIGMDYEIKYFPDYVMPNQFLNASSENLLIGSILYGRMLQESYSSLASDDNQIVVFSENLKEEEEHYLKHRSFTLGGRGIRIDNLVPLGDYALVSPFRFDIHLFLWALSTEDLSLCYRLGLMEFSPEEFSVFNFICPNKYDYVAKAFKMLKTS